MNKEDQHIDQLFQSLKEDKFVASQSFMDDLKLRVDAKAKLAARRKLVLWFVMTSIVLVAIASIILYTVQSDSVSESHRKISLSKVGLNSNVDSLALSIQNQKNVVRIDSLNLNSDALLSQNDLNSNREEIDKNDLEHQDQKETPNLNKQFENSTKSNSSRSRVNVSKKQLNNTKSNILVSNSTGNKGKNTKIDLSENNVELSRRSEATKKAALDSKGILGSSASTQNSDQKNSDREENNLTEAKNSNLPISSIYSNKTTSNSKDLVLQMRLKQAIDNPFDVSLVERNSLLTNSIAITNNSRKKLEFNLEAYGGFLYTSSNYKPVSSADGYKSSPLISSSFGLKTSLIHQNIYGSLGVEYFKTGDKQTFETTTFSQIGIDSTQTITYFDTVWVDSVSFYIDSLIDYQITPIFDSITNSNQFKNQYTWITIPLSFGYRFQYNSWDFIPNVGANLNFGIGQNSGQYPDASNQLVKYKALKFNMDIRIQTEVRKNFGKYYVFVSPYFKKNLKPLISSPSLRLTQNNWGMNGGFGVKF